MITDPPILTIRRGAPRPPVAVVDAFRDVPTGFLVDAMGGRGGLDHTIRPLPAAAGGFTGVAMTCHCGPADNLAAFGALDAAEMGDVIIASTDAFMGTAVTGDLLLGMMRNKGVVGFVTDGLVRDIVGIEAVGLPVYCAGLTPNSPARNGPGIVGAAIILGGVSIETGDIVVADRDGVVIVPRVEAEAVLARLPAIRASEQQLDQKVRDGLQVPDFIQSILKSDKTRYVD